MKGLNKKNQYTFNIGQPLEIELLDGEIRRGAFFQRWIKENEEPKVVIIEQLGNSHEKVHYIEESKINDIRLLGPHGTPNLYLVK